MPGGRGQAAGPAGNPRRKGGGQRAAKLCPRCAAPLRPQPRGSRGGGGSLRRPGAGGGRRAPGGSWAAAPPGARSSPCGSAEGGAGPRRSTGAAAPAGQAGRAPAHGRSRARRQPRARRRRRRPERGLAAARRGCRAAGAQPARDPPCPLSRGPAARPAAPPLPLCA